MLNMRAKKLNFLKSLRLKSLHSVDVQPCILSFCFGLKTSSYSPQRRLLVSLTCLFLILCFILPQPSIWDQDGLWAQEGLKNSSENPKTSETPSSPNSEGANAEGQSPPTPPESTQPAEDAFLAHPVVQKLKAGGTESALFAQSFLNVILDGKPEAIEYRKLLLEALEPKKVITSPDRILVAVQLVSALAYLASTGKTFPEGTQLLVPLIGVGPDSLKKAVRDALVKKIVQEKSSDPKGGSQTIVSIGSRMTTNHPPRMEVLHEASEILWRVDGKILLTYLIDGLLKNQKNQGAEDGAPESISGYILELRERFRLELEDPRQWEKWWDTWKSKNLEAILAEAQRLDDQRRLQLWKNNLGRLKDSGDPVRLLSSIKDTFIFEKAHQIRAASILELKSFPLWLREGLSSPGAISAQDRKKHLSTAIHFLLEILEGRNGFRFVSIDEKTRSIEALSTFGEILTEDQELKGKVIEVVEKELQKYGILPQSIWDDKSHKYSLELIRAVGALRLEDLEIKEFLVKALSLPEKESIKDPVWITAVVTALGRVTVKQEHPASIALILEIYQSAKLNSAKSKTEKAWLDLRKACVVALNLPISSPQRTKVRELYKSILMDAQPSSERIPAIIGLGILARASDDESVKLLEDALKRKAQFDVGEVSSIINALAYLGGEAALEVFIQFLNDKDVAFQDQVWKRTVSLAKAENGKLLDSLLARLQQQAFAKNDISFIEAIVKLSKEAGLKEHFQSQTVSQGTEQQKKQYYHRELHRLRSHELTGDLATVLTGLKTLEAFINQSADLKKALPKALEDIGLLNQRAQLMKKAQDAFKSKPALSPQEVLLAHIELFKQCSKLAPEMKSGSTTLVEMRWHLLSWLTSRVTLLSPSPQSLKLVEDLTTTVSSPDNAKYFEGLDPSVMTRFSDFLKSEKVRLAKQQK